MRRSMVAASLAALAACAVGPNYVRPAVTDTMPTAYKEAGTWKQAEPKDEEARGTWWQLFGDPALDAMEERVALANQTLKAAEAQYRAAEAAIAIARAGLFPTVGGSAAVTRAHNAVGVTGVPAAGSGDSISYELPFTLSWEIDVWGRVRRAIESAKESAQASAGDVGAARLSAQALLAQSYLQLETYDAERALLDAAVADYERSLELTRNRYASGVAAQTDVLQAETQLESTRAQAIDVGVLRAQTEHAIAVLMGQPPAGFSIAPNPLKAEPPPIPIDLPSALLERRPDVAAAERRVAAANAEIGVATAAWFPQLSLNLSIGLLASSLTKLFSLPSLFWSVGPVLSQTLFEGGLRAAQVNQARALYDASVATYRQTALGAFQDVEDNLAAIRILEQEAQAQQRTVTAAKQVVTVTLNQYKAGTVSYLEVSVAQTTALTAERTAIDVQGRRMAATVLLIKALGGGWKGLKTP